MPYKKIGWVSGETPLSATNFNHMEEGISTIDSAVGTDAYDPTKTYSKGDYFIYDDSLCKAIADIAAGAELLSGVNYSTTTVREELTELNSKSVKYAEHTFTNLSSGTYWNNHLVILSSNVYNTFGIPTTSVIIGFNIVDISDAGCPLNLYVSKSGILRFVTDSKITNGNITVRIAYI